MYGRHVQKSAFSGSSIFCCGTGYAWCYWISCELFMMTSKYPCVKDVLVLIYFVPTPTLAIELFVSISTEHCPPPLTWNCKVWISWNTMWCIISDGKRNNRCHQNPNMHEKRYFIYGTMAKKPQQQPLWTLPGPGMAPGGDFNGPESCFSMNLGLIWPMRQILCRFHTLRTAFWLLWHDFDQKSHFWNPADLKWYFEMNLMAYSHLAMCQVAWVLGSFWVCL